MGDKIPHMVAMVFVMPNKPVYLEEEARQEIPFNDLCQESASHGCPLALGPGHRELGGRGGT